jgi:glycosyltransferase involved in cell wall biosynthesis
MSARRKSVSLISSRINSLDLPLQPWRYLHEVALQLTHQGHDVTIITDGEADSRLDGNGSGVRYCRVPSVGRYHLRQNEVLQQVLQDNQPEVILWHVGMTSFLHQQMQGWPSVPVVGIFPGVVYQPRDFAQVGIRNLVNEFRLVWIHILGGMTPRRLLRRPVEKGWLSKLVTLTHTTREQLIRCGISPQSVQTISPGIDEIWFHPPSQNGYASGLREQLGFNAQDKIILYFGSPQPLRGLHDLVRAFEIAHPSDPNLKLLILSRRREDELLKENAGLKLLLDNSSVREHIKVVSGFLDQEKLVEYMSLSLAVALPFQIVPADAPLSLLEAQAQGKPVITTRVASLPEMVAGGSHYLANPADPVSLAQALLDAAKEKGRDPAQPSRELQNSSPALRRWHQVGEEWSRLVQSL